LIIELIW